MLLGVVEHGCADAVFAVGAFEDVDVDTSLAAAPERLVVGQVVEGHRLIAELRIHCHDGCTAGQTEYFGVWPSGACEREGHLLNVFGYTSSSVIGVDDETRSGYIMLVAPRLNITESCEDVTVEGDDSLGLSDFGHQIFVGALGNTGTAHFGGVGNGFQYGVDIFLV